MAPPIRHVVRHWFASALPIAIVATCVGVSVLVSARLVESESELVLLGSFRTTDLVVDNQALIGGSAVVGSDMAVAGNLTEKGNRVVSAVGSGLSKSGPTASLNITPTSCGAGSAITAINALGSGTCAAAGSVISGLTANQTVKAASSSSIANGWATDDGTTWGSAGKFTITEANGNFASAGSGTITGNLSAGSATIPGAVTAGSFVGVNNTGALVLATQTLAISATQNNLAINKVGIISLTHVSGADLTGIAMSGGNVDGTVLYLNNPSATDIIALETENTGSTATNRIVTPGSIEIFVEVNGGAILHYVGSGTTGRWHLFAWTTH